jgi:hypothetical protein
MTSPLFTTNDADFVKLEGVYIKETNPPAGVTEASLNTVGVFGKTLKGPDTPVVITSESRFVEVFGGGYLNGVRVNDVWTSLLNKGFSQLVVCRARAAAAVKASFTVETAAGGAGTAIARIDASSVGTWGNNVRFKVEAASNGVSTQWNLRVIDDNTGRSYLYENINTGTGADNTAEIFGTDPGRIIDVVKLASGRPNNNVAATDGADADGYVNLGETVAAFTSVAGTDGSIADSDYTGTAKPLQLIAGYPGVAVVYCAEYMSDTIKAAMEVSAAATSDRMFIIGSDSSSVSYTDAITDVADYPSDRIIYTFNHCYTIDPETASEIATSPSSWMACILANTDVDIHPGEEDTKRYLAGITRLHWPSLVRGDYELLRAAGIAALEIDLGSPVFVSGVTTSREAGKREITRRRMADFLQLSAAYSLRFHVKKKNTPERRRAIASVLKGWLSNLARAGRVVDRDDSGNGLFQIDTEILNNPTDRANGIERILMRVRLVGHMLHVVLQTEIGTGVDFSVTAN